MLLTFISYVVVLVVGGALGFLFGKKVRAAADAAIEATKKIG
jgi:hypothetical protein